jgi:hypothetical protein
VAAGIVRGVGGGADGEACGGRPTAEAAGRRREREARRAQAMWAAWGGEASCRHSSRLPLKRCWWVVAVLICVRWSFRLVGAVAGGRWQLRALCTTGRRGGRGVRERDTASASS